MNEPAAEVPRATRQKSGRDRKTLIEIVVFALAIVGIGYIGVGPTIFLFSLTLIGGLVIWFLTACGADIDPHEILAPYLLTVIFFIGHVFEEYVAHIERALPGAHAVVRDMERLKDLISNEFNRHEFVLRVETSVIFNRVDRYTMPASAPSRGQTG